MKISKLICNGSHIGYRFFIDKYAYDCLSVQVYKDFGGAAVRSVCNVYPTPNNIYVEMNPKKRYNLIPASYTAISNMIWLYNNGFKDIDKGKKYKFKNYGSGYQDLSNGTIVIVDECIFERGTIIVHTEVGGEAYEISMYQIALIQ